MKYFKLLLLLSLYLSSCGSKDERASNTATSTSDKTAFFEKLDSIRINYLGSPIVHDIDPESRKVLFMEHREYSGDIMVGDFDGKILMSFSKSGDMPDSFGSLRASLRFDGDSSFVVYGTKGLFTYGLNGRLQSEVEFTDSRYDTPFRIGMGSGMEKLGNSYLYLSQGYPGKNFNDLGFYEEVRLLTWMDADTGGQEPFIQFPETSIFRSDRYFFKDAWSPVFSLVKNRVCVAFGIEPVIYIYDTSPPYSLLSSIPLNLPGYRYFKGADRYSSDVGFFGQRRVSGRILNIKKIDGYFVVAYFQGFNVSDAEEQFTNKSPAEARVFTERMQKKYPPRIAILDSVGNRLNDFVPEGLVASSMLVRNGELWMQEKPNEEVEEDYFRLFRVGLRLSD